MADKLSPMQEQLLQRADSIFTSISAGVAKAGEFASEQIPDIAMQYVAFGRAYNTTAVLGSLILIVIYGFVLRKLYRTGNMEIFFPVAILGGFATGSITIPIFLSHIKSFLLVWYAPKIWLITEIVSLVK